MFKSGRRVCAMREWRSSTRAASLLASTLGSGVAVVLGVSLIGAMARVPGSLPQQAEGTSRLDDPDDPLVRFAALMPVIGHPRCANCHGGSNPFEGINHPPNAMLSAVASRLRDANGDHDFANQGSEVCNSCHNAVETAWVLAHGFSRFKDQTARQVCLLWKTSLHDDASELLHHLQTDALIKIAFQGNKNIDDPAVLVDKPPMSVPEFMGKVRQWLNGATFIPCAGWVGTITQTEHVSLTTNYSVAQAVAAGIEEHTTEVQEATRTVEIIVAGGVELRIAVQGIHRRDHTLTTRQGAQSCALTEEGLEQYGTPKGTTSAKAQRAEVKFFAGGAYRLSIQGPEERTERVERVSTTHCLLGTLPVESSTVEFTNAPWTVDIDGLLANPADRTVLKGTKTETITAESRAWLTASGGRVSPMQARQNGEYLPVPVEVTTTWDLHRVQ